MDEKKKEEKVVNSEKEVKKEEAKETPKTETKKEEKKVESKKAETKTEVKAEKKPEFKKVEAKKVETKKKEKSKNKGKKTWLSKALVIIVVLAIAALLTVMIVTSSDPKKSTDGLLNNLKAGDFETAQEFLSGTSLVNDNNFDEETEKLLFDKLEWKITKITQEDDSATIELEVTNKNFQTIISSYMQKALKAAFGGENVEQSEIENYFKDELKNEQVQKATNNVTIKAVKEDKKWKIVADDDLVDALLPGLRDAVNSIG